MLSPICFSAGGAALFAAFMLFRFGDRQAHANAIRDLAGFGVFLLVLGLALPSRLLGTWVAVCFLGWAVCMPRVGE